MAARGDVASLPQPLKNMLVRLADRPHSILPVQARAEADAPSQLFQSYLLDTTGLEPNVFTRIFERFAVTREINDGLLAPRFSPSQWAWVLSGTRVAVNPAVPVSAGRDADDR